MCFLACVFVNVCVCVCVCANVWVCVLDQSVHGAEAGGEGAVRGGGGGGGGLREEGLRLLGPGHPHQALYPARRRA